jgi:hypothetical protein
MLSFITRRTKQRCKKYSILIFSVRKLVVLGMRKSPLYLGFFFGQFKRGYEANMSSTTLDVVFIMFVIDESRRAAIPFLIKIQIV